jgi:hypothetical protein
VNVVCLVVILYEDLSFCRAHWGMGLIFHQAKPRQTRDGGWGILGPLEFNLGMRSQAATSLISRQMSRSYCGGGVVRKQDQTSCLCHYLFYSIHTYIQIYIG